MTDNTNPWGLSPREAQAMDAYCETGCQKLAAHKLGISPRTVQNYCGRAKEKIGANDGGGGGLLYILKWDRWRQSTGVRS